MQTSPRGAIAHNVLLPRDFQIQLKSPWPLTFQIILKFYKFTYGIWFDKNRL